jgi:hypothetical protein
MWKPYKSICLEKYFYKNINIPLFNKYFHKDKESKLEFKDRVAILNVFIYIYEESILLYLGV